MEKRKLESLIFNCIKEKNLSSQLTPYGGRERGGTGGGGKERGREEENRHSNPFISKSKLKPPAKGWRKEESSEGGGGRGRGGGGGGGGGGEGEGGLEEVVGQYKRCVGVREEWGVVSGGVGRMREARHLLNLWGEEEEEEEEEGGEGEEEWERERGGEIGCGVCGARGRCGCWGGGGGGGRREREYTNSVLLMGFLLEVDFSKVNFSAKNFIR